MSENVRIFGLFSRIDTKPKEQKECAGHFEKSLFVTFCYFFWHIKKLVSTVSNFLLSFATFLTFKKIAPTKSAEIGAEMVQFSRVQFQALRGNYTRDFGQISQKLAKETEDRET